MSKEQKHSFVFYRSFHEAIQDLSASGKLVIYEAITQYALDKVEPELSGFPKTIFKLIQPQLDANWRRYENGKNGGAPEGNQNARKTTKKQANVRFVQIPHFGVYSYIKHGYMGCAQNSKQKQYTMAQLTDVVRERYGIDWAFFGFKQSDSLNRRVMLRTYESEAINEKSKKCYPLSPYKNRDILNYIESEDLIRPESYGKAQSQGCNITDLDYLLYLRDEFPCDLEKVLAEFPLVERLLFEYDHERTQAE